MASMLAIKNHCTLIVNHQHLLILREGHHCLAFSSFIRGAQSKPPKPRDYYAPINHYLKEFGYNPNDINNVIDLPGRKKNGDEDDDAQFKNFEKACTTTPPKPLQLHIGGHKSDMMMASDRLIQDIYNLMKRPDECSVDEEEWKDSLLENIQEAEDEAFDKTASKTYPFICHPGPLNSAK